MHNIGGVSGLGFTWKWFGSYIQRSRKGKSNFRANEVVTRMYFQYINSFGEVSSGDDLDFVRLEGTNIKERSVKIEEITANPAIRQFKPKSRKCRFIDEPSSEYFDVTFKTLNCQPFSKNVLLDLHSKPLQN